MLDAALGASDALGEDFGKRRFISVESLRRVFCEWSEVLGKVEVARQHQIPPPPIAGLRSPHTVSEPLARWRDLLREGQENHNCSLSYAEIIARATGTQYAYRVLKPERATVLIQRVGANADQFSISELEAPSNAAVSDTTRAAVDDWLAQAFERTAQAREHRRDDLRGRLATRAGVALTLSHFANEKEGTSRALLDIARHDAGSPPQLRAIAAAGRAKTGNPTILTRLRELTATEPDPEVRRRMAFTSCRAEVEATKQAKGPPCGSGRSSAAG